MLINKFIRVDDSDLVNLGKDFKFNSNPNNDFSEGRNYISSFSMSELSMKIIELNNLRKQIEFFLKFS